MMMMSSTNDSCIQILKDRLDEIEKNITLLQTNRQFILKYLQENIQTFKDQLNLFKKKMTTLQNNIQVKMAMTEKNNKQTIKKR